MVCRIQRERENTAGPWSLFVLARQAVTERKTKTGGQRKNNVELWNLLLPFFPRDEKKKKTGRRILSLLEIQRRRRPGGMCHPE